MTGNTLPASHQSHHSPLHGTCHPCCVDMHRQERCKEQNCGNDTQPRMQGVESAHEIAAFVEHHAFHLFVALAVLIDCICVQPHRHHQHLQTDSSADNSCVHSCWLSIPGMAPAMIWMENALQCIMIPVLGAPQARAPPRSWSLKGHTC